MSINISSFAVATVSNESDNLVEDMRQRNMKIAVQHGLMGIDSCYEGMVPFSSYMQCVVFLVN